MPAIVVASLIGAGAAVGSAAIQSHQAGKAVKAQTTSAGNALDAQKQARDDAKGYIDAAQRNLDATSRTQGQLYQQQVQNLAPFSSLGNGAATLLGQGLGVPVSMPQPVSVSSPSMANGGMAPLSAVGAPNQLTPYDPGNAQGIVTNPRFAPLSNEPRSAGGPGSVPTGATAVPRGTLADVAPVIAAQAQRGSSYVVIQAPSGETQQVPAAQASHFLSRGGKIVGGGSAGV